MSKSKVLFIMTGSIACYKACQVVSRLVQAGNEVQVVASPAALQFVGNATFEGLTGKPVVSDLYAAGNVMDHIHLMRWADLIVVAPATANYINKVSQGIGDDLLTTLFLAHDFKKPFLIAPAMNTSMYLHPVTQSSIKRLKEMGIEILETASGVLACGETGFGRLIEPDLMLTEIQSRLQKDSTSETHNKIGKMTARPLRVLITAGGTIEPIDTVRSITNTSTGQSGARLAELLNDFGVEVHLLRSSQGKKASSLISQSTFTSFQSLQTGLQALLAENDFDVVIHMAAVSDFSVDALEVNGSLKKTSEVSKIRSSDTLKIHLKHNPKIVDQIKAWSRNSKVLLVAFKLTSHASEAEKTEAVQKLKTQSKADWVVQNDIAEIDTTRNIHPFVVFDAKSSDRVENIETLASELMQKFLKEIPS